MGPYTLHISFIDLLMYDPAQYKVHTSACWYIHLLPPASQILGHFNFVLSKLF